MFTLFTSEQAAYRLLRLFSKVRARSFRCSSSPTAIRSAGFAVGLGVGREVNASKVFTLSTSEQSPLCSDVLLFLRNKRTSSARSLAPPSQITTASLGCDLVPGRKPESWSLESVHAFHVGAAAYRLLRLFYKKSERTHSAAPPFRTEPAALGFGPSGRASAPFNYLARISL